jgi:predicted metal-binding membrane protein
LTPIKHACLRTCQSPLGCVMSRCAADRLVHSRGASSTAHIAWGAVGR